MSRLDDTLTAIADQYADATVSFEAGKLVLNKNAQQRKIALVRQSGDLKFSSAPGKRAFGVPVSGAGTTTIQRFERFELLEATLRAEDEDALDAMFDRFVNAVFEVFGPNAFEDTNQYEWFQGDSSNGGDWARRNPSIKLYVRVRLKSRSQPGPYAVVGSADATLTLKDAEGIIGATADFSPSDVPAIAAGEYWLPGVGVSVASWTTWAGQNGTGNDLLVGLANTPEAVTGPGGYPAWQYVAANSDVFTVQTPTAPLTSTDGVYVAFWFRFDVLNTAFQTLVERYNFAGQRSWTITKTGSLQNLQIAWSDDGTNLLVSNFNATEAEGVGTVSTLDKYLFCEVLIDPTASGLAGKTRLWLNGQEKTLAQSGTGGASLANTGVFRVGNAVFSNQDFNGQVGPIYYGRRVGGVLLPSDDDRAALMRHRTPKDTRMQVILHGNSLTQGQGATVPGVTSYPGVLRASLVSLGYQGRDVHDRGLGGLTSQQMIDQFPTTVAPFADAIFRTQAYVFFEVRNSFISGATAAQIIDQHRQLAALAYAAGMYPVVCTAPGSDGTPAGVGIPGEVNAWIRANWQTFAGAFVDLELAPEFSPSGDILNPTYYSDGVHLTDAGYAAVAGYVLDALLETTA